MGQLKDKSFNEGTWNGVKLYACLLYTSIALGRSGVAPDSAEGTAFAQAYWDMILTFTGGDLSMLPQLVELGQAEGMDPQWRETQTQANACLLYTSRCV